MMTAANTVLQKIINETSEFWRQMDIFYPDMVVPHPGSTTNGFTINQLCATVMQVERGFGPNFGMLGFAIQQLATRQPKPFAIITSHYLLGRLVSQLVGLREPFAAPEWEKDFMPTTLFGCSIGWTSAMIRNENRTAELIYVCQPETLLKYDPLAAVKISFTGLLS